MSSPLDLSQEPWVPNEFVVALPHLPVVLAALDGFPQPVELPQPQESKILDLALITIGNVDDVARRINGELGPGKPRRVRPGSPEYAIDRVIRAIREGCAERYGGWIPTIGKNRMLDGVHTTQHVGTGSAEVYPSPATPADLGDLSADAAGDRAVVGVVDTALWAHPELEGRYQPHESNVHLAPADWHWHTAGHATFVGAAILQDSPNVQLLVRRALDSDGTARTWKVAEEMVRLGRSVDVLNISFACFTDDNEEPLLLARAIEMVGPDTVVVAAAGNFADCELGGSRRAPASCNSPMWPAASSRVIAVGAHDAGGKRATFSPDVPWVDLTARGVDVGSLYLKGTVRFRDHKGVEPSVAKEFLGYAKWTGTSFSAAVASGAIARRIRRGDGISARRALERVQRLQPGNREGVWRYESV